MSEQSFENRVFGAVIIKAINSNYNADFNHQPRTLPDGIVYATDKALKYTVKNYFMHHCKGDTIFYFKRHNENLNPLSLNETYRKLFGEFETVKDGSKTIVKKLPTLANLLQCMDIRLFGATFAGETNISIHGPVQIGHGINRFPENEIYSEQIMSPFRNEGSKEKKAESEKEQSTLGTQSKLREGHYVHHFSINPLNLDEHVKLLKQEKLKASGLLSSDVEKLKEGLCHGATMLDSASKAGTENEMLIWIQLKKGSRKTLPSLTDLVNIERNPEGKVIIDLGNLKEILNEKSISEAIESIELYYNAAITKVIHEPAGATVKAMA
jgi:CRISPR-associated protein Csh2